MKKIRTPKDFPENVGMAPLVWFLPQESVILQVLNETPILLTYV